MKVSATLDSYTTRLKNEAEKARQRAIRSALEALAEQQRRRGRDSDSPDDAASPDATFQHTPRS